MATHQSHISFAAIIAVLYAAAGILYFGIPPELSVLAAVIVIITGILPDVDAGKEAPARELAGLVAAVAPMLLLEYYPSLKTGGMARIALVVVLLYMLTRMIIIRSLQKFAIHRGMIHSVPAAIITGELTYLLFWDLFWTDRVFLSCAALAGFFSHLFLDAYSNLDLLGKAMGNGAKKASALKFYGPSRGATFAMYGCAILLGWFVMKDMYPQLSFRAPAINY